jgi:hypothetical protein
VGETDNDGKLLNAERLIENGVISSFVTLKLSAFDIDSDFAEKPECTPRERDRIKINGQNIGLDGAEVFLTGTTDRWKTVSYKIPVDLVRFGKWMCSGGTCSGQGAGENNIDIDISTAAPQPYQCATAEGNTTVEWAAKVDWGAITVDALYPVALLHGYSSSGAFWRDPDHKFVDPFNQQKILYDDSVDFPNRGKDGIFPDALYLLGEINRIANKFKVKHVHLVTHSKAGLVSRMYVTLNQQDFAVASLTTLSTMHQGTSQADFSLDLREVGVTGAFNTGDSLLEDFVLFLTRFFARKDDALLSMRVSNIRDFFNPQNGPRLPDKMEVDGESTTVRYFSRGADANDGSTDAAGNPTISSEEAAGSPFVKKAVLGPIVGRRAAEQAYRFLYKVAETTVDYTNKNGRQVPFKILFIPNASGTPNDFFVTTLSSRFITTAKIAPQHLGDETRNHQRIAHPDVANATIQLIKAANPKPSN